MSSHYVCWRGQVYRFDADTPKKARAKAFRWLDAHGYGWRSSVLSPTSWNQADRGVA